MSRTVNVTPTWTGLLPLLLEVAMNAETVEARRTAREELQRMARIADAAVSLVAAAKAMDDAMDEAQRPPDGDDYNELYSRVSALGAP
jgi:hypothetical protein